MALKLLTNLDHTEAGTGGDFQETAFGHRVRLVRSYNIPESPSRSIIVYHSITGYNNIFLIIDKKIKHRKSGRDNESGRSSRSQKIFKIEVLKNFANFTRKRLC